MMPMRGLSDIGFPRALELVLKAESVAPRCVRNVALPEKELRAGRDVEITVKIDHRIGQIVNASFQPETMQRRVLTQYTDLRVEDTGAEVKVALAFLEHRVPRRIVADRVSPHHEAGARMREHDEVDVAERPLTRRHDGIESGIVLR